MNFQDLTCHLCNTKVDQEYTHNHLKCKCKTFLLNKINTNVILHYANDKFYKNALFPSYIIGMFFIIDNKINTIFSTKINFENTKEFSDFADKYLENSVFI